MPYPVKGLLEVYEDMASADAEGISRRGFQINPADKDKMNTITVCLNIQYNLYYGLSKYCAQNSTKLKETVSAIFQSLRLIGLF